MLIETSLVKNKDNGPRVLVVSVRGFRSQVANCAIYEFEDLICDLEGAQLYAPKQEFDFARCICRLAKYATGSDRIASVVAPFPAEVVLEEEYDLLLAVFDNPWQLHLLEGIKNWREKCRHTACYIIETWKPNFDDWRLAYEPFKNFEYIFSGTVNCVETFKQVTGLPCHYLAPGLDALKFCPYPNTPKRMIDACCVGRRPAEAHQMLFDRSQQEDNFFYYYNTINNTKLEVGDPKAHRAKLINLLQRSRYNIAAHARFDALSETGGHQEIGYRYFEGVAAGTILVGMPPMGDVFPRYFDWEDAIVRVNLYEQNVLEVMEELNNQPEKVEAMRRRNVVNSLRKHDWVYRWREMLSTFDLEPSQAMLDRERQLQQLADSVDALDTSLVC
ncbi:glycosyltransferase [Leptothoe kymatousa]|uniref:Glycosyltransferase family 1 protein n=1 Tax=Leptothoe kymatousa TAU-MAC 1615 TaxID=2364775 RepID=A0ABS5XZ99_9CYAN|nr:glycosyltransferase [Leptothoe kymatousa]MBT9310883.1 glycosyltransferase family 1 protein [Leptothoe kymatousa TAU-MAC 1615]